MSQTEIGRPARARLGTWPREPGVAHLVLLDHQSVPRPHDVERWVASARADGTHTIRTNALFPPAAEVFSAAGFRSADELALMELDLTTWNAERGTRTRRMRAADLDTAAEIDRRAFGTSWSNDASSLRDIQLATPHHRSRVIESDRRPAGFAISGRAGQTGYVQRLAVDPDRQGSGLGRSLVLDALGWMRRRGVRHALVNTGVGNEVALELYRSVGFRIRDDRLLIMERAIG